MILRWLWNGEAGGNFGAALSDNQVTVIAGEGGVAAALCHRSPCGFGLVKLQRDFELFWSELKRFMASPRNGSR